MLRFESMAIGALGAWLYFQQHWVLRIVYRLQLLWIAVLALVILFPFNGGVQYDIAISIVFMGFILNVSTNPKTLLKLEYPLLSKFGQVTYGIYMYHLLVIDVVGMISRQIGAGDAIYLGGVVATSIGVALLSYRFIELPFLKRKPYRHKEPVERALQGLQKQSESPVA
jgi:peptidoglycan/LPS O-acetylase OafA/YrhL